MEKPDGGPRAGEPPPKEDVGGLNLVPEVGGLLTTGLPVNLAALDQALRSLTDPVTEAGERRSALVYWAAIASCGLGGALAYAVARRRRAATNPDYLSRPDFFPEELL